MWVNCTYCSKKKARAKELLPAIDRYQSERIGKVHQESIEKGIRFFILSGKFGLIHCRSDIPYYDHLLTFDEVPKLIDLLSSQLSSNGIKHIRYFTERPDMTAKIKPYLYAIEIACGCKGVTFRVDYL